MSLPTSMHDLNAERLHAWFPVADLGEIALHRDDSAALIDYLSYCNDLTPTETAEMLEALAPDLLTGDRQKTLRAA